MADVRISQNIAQCEWQDPPLLKAIQAIAQVEYEPEPYGTYTGNLIVELTPESTTIQDFAYTGEISFSLTPESGYGTGNYYTGALTVSLIPESDIIVSIAYTGAIEFSLTPESDVIGDHSYEGLVTTELIPESVYAIPIPGFDWYSGYGLVDLTFLDGNPPYHVTYGDIPVTVSLSSTVELYAEYEIIASGGVNVSGEGIAEFSVPPVFELVASGGVKISGKGTVEYLIPSVFELIASGEITLAGEGTFEFVDPEDEEEEYPVFELTALGGVDVSGIGTVGFITPTTFELVASGGIKVAGRGTVVFAEPEETFILEVVASGGVKVSARPEIEFFTPQTVVYEVTATGGVEVNGNGILVYLRPLVLEVIGEGGVEVGGDYDTYTYHTWVITGLTFEPSIYSGFDFNSYSAHQGKCYGLKDDGLYVLEGDTDDGKDIHTGVRFGASNFGKEGRNKLRSIRFGVDDGDDINARVSTARSADYADLSRNRKIMINRTVFGDDIDVEIADFEKLGSMELAIIYRK